MATLEDASLSADERRVVERFVVLMRQRLQSVWLYGSRARGEMPIESAERFLLALDELLGDR